MKALLQQSLDALEAMKAEFRGHDLPYGSKAYTQANEASHALRAELAQPAPAVPDAPPFDFAEWHGNLMMLADAYWESSTAARHRYREKLRIHALNAGQHWKARSMIAAAPTSAPAAPAVPDALMVSERSRLLLLETISDLTKALNGRAALAVPAVREPLTDEQINAIWNAKDLPEDRSNLTPWGMDRVRAIIAAAGSAAPAVQPLHDWEFVAMWATAAEKHGDTYDVAVEFGRAVEARCVVTAPAVQPLTDDAITRLMPSGEYMMTRGELRDFARAIERAHGITGDSNG